MELFGFILIVSIAAVVFSIAKSMTSAPTNSDYPRYRQPERYFYRRKDYIMTAAEGAFFRRLENICADKYYVFPQIHLSALLSNNTKGKYWKAAFQRINRTSVDYVLVNKETLRTAYAVELDDSTHDRPERQARDEGVEDMLGSAGIVLVRFRNAANMSDDEIIKKFTEEKGATQEQVPDKP